MFNQKEYNKQYYQNNLEKAKKYRKQYNKDNFERRKEWNRQFRENNPEYMKQYRKDNIEKTKEYRDKYYIEHKEETIRHKRIYHSIRRKTDLKFNLIHKMGKAIGKSLKGNKNGRHWETLIGYTLSDLIKRLKSTIPEGYTWQDFMQGKLHIDHIIPIKVFIFKTPEDKEFKDCWSLYNLRLLPSEENRLKQDTIDNPILLNLLLNEVV